MRKFNVYILLHAVYEAPEAAEMSMNDIAERDGMEIIKHEVIESES